ncbi:hypothetical protein CHLNCDRAFT_140355 [Chlorella variabilis]|uniref:non-reducing end alpha-L-arabinofuranosidase n=1 Tax=Chlorella variabilis TaxID=554065 RepID=E1Z6U8_CHLVA|nr:hypothetical protein CHLNCDRAFT_140355 [Chlorella variabilis]EFN58711.1 hypothetical protein CHLNCDRAFT_140355 [Chlorella variabilis]|eukprot:XP_005850813.1 hypothetical protein CHLNCDRAFT_140355 [Chlorella variabilis]
MRELRGTTTTLTREQPVCRGNPVAMELGSGGGGGRAGLVNTGYWGVSVEAGTRYSLSLYLRVPEGAGPSNATVSLLAGGDEAGGVPLASASFTGLTLQWQRYRAELASSATDHQARLAVLFDGPGRLAVDSVSLVAAANAEQGQAQGLLNPWPFRADLLAALKALQPRFLRFPGGCYVEGDWLRGAFRWKEALGRNEERPGHHNRHGSSRGMWGYWSTDGLGLFEYLLLAEELGAEPVWVVNNGIAHNDQVATRDIWPWEALDGIEFISGPANSTWGAVRAAMGRPQPWRLNFLAIGNEASGAGARGLHAPPAGQHGLPAAAASAAPRHCQWNYLALYSAIKAAHPHLRLIANCHLGDLGPTEIWEYHVYTNPQDLFARRHAFDGATPAGGLIFASEYAVTDGGGQGNLIGAVAEAAFMTGMERNSGGGGAVLAGAYAPLMVNANARPWPTNMLVFDNHRVFGIPSFHVQQLLSRHLGTQLVGTEVAGGAEDWLAASATCQSKMCDEVAVKVVNFSPSQQLVGLRIRGLAAGSLGATGQLLVLGGQQPLDENSFHEPLKVATRTEAISGVAEQFELALPAWSVSVLKLRIVPPAAKK